MLKKIIDKRNHIIYIIIVILFITILVLNLTKLKTTTKTFNYFNEQIKIELHTKQKPTNIVKAIDKIYKKYDNFNKNPDRANDKDLIKLLKYGQELYNKTGGYIDITSYELLHNIKEDKTYNFKTSINQLNFNDKNTLVNINIENIVGAYATKEVENYLEEKGINSYIIKEDSNIITKNPDNKQNYNIPIIKNDDIINVLSIKNKSIAIKGDIDTFKPYMVNPITSTKNKETKLVVVISDDINKANYIANTIYLMDNEKIAKYVKKYKVEAMWQSGTKPFKTKGFKKYELIK